ncbi:MAG: galactose oxidase-like domain-containing protein, partial [Acidimicrobiia bacterium]
WYNEPSLAERDKGDDEDIGWIELEGIRNTRAYNPDTMQFEDLTPMKFGRWYPTLVAMPDGTVSVFSGVTKLIKSTQASSVRRTERFDPAKNAWSEEYVDVRSEMTLPLQARLFLMPNGKIFYNATGQNWGPFGQAADEALHALQKLWDPETKQWEIVGPSILGARNGAFEVMLPLKPPYDKGTILSYGGNLGAPPGTYAAVHPLTTLSTVDAEGHVTNQLTGVLNHRRWFSSGVLLPDGTVAAVGGSDKDHVIAPGTDSAVKSTEIYDPDTGLWTEVASHTRDRAYHSSAVLLPDGRLLFGGHAPIATMYGTQDNNQLPTAADIDKDPSFEVWSPPYLFRGARPTITRAPAGVEYGSSFTVETPEATDIESVALMRMPSAQHVNDPDQRLIELDFSASKGSLSAVAPPAGAAAPPGYYYLFVNKRGVKGPVPSVAKIVVVGRTVEGDAPQPFPNDAPEVTGGDASDPAQPSYPDGGGAEGSSSPVPSAEELPSTQDGTPAASPGAVADPATAASAVPLSAVPLSAADLAGRPVASSRPLPTPASALVVLAVLPVGMAVGRRVLRLKGRRG